MSIIENLPLNVSYDPNWGRKWSALRCDEIWNEATTEAFLKYEFVMLRLFCEKGQSLHIPPLGDKAKSIKWVDCNVAGTLTGLEQFCEIEGFFLADRMPENGLNLSSFKNIHTFSCEWKKIFSDSIIDWKKLNELDINGFLEKDCAWLGKLINLRMLGLGQGRIESLMGLETCVNLEKISLAHLRNLKNFGKLDSFSQLKMLACESLPKIEGILDLKNFKNLEYIRIVSCENLKVDLSFVFEMLNLRRLWLTCPHINLDINKLLSLNRLEMIALTMTNELCVFTDEDLMLMAEKSKRNLTKISRIGPKKKPTGLQLIFDNSDLKMFSF